MGDNTNKLLKYILMGLISAISLYYVPSTSILYDEILMVSFVISICYAILDRIMPSIIMIENNKEQE